MSLRNKRLINPWLKPPCDPKDHSPHFNSRSSSQISFLICSNNVQPGRCDVQILPSHHPPVAWEYKRHQQYYIILITLETWILQDYLVNLHTFSSFFFPFKPSTNHQPAIRHFQPRPPSTVSKSAAWAPAAIPCKLPGKWGRINENSSVV